MPTNVLGTELKCCCRDPITGFFRDGFCRTGPEDIGLHTVCVKVTREFLDFSVLDGNDLVTPVPEWGFPGLKPGDKWCVCVTRWKSALERNRAAPVDLEATHTSALEFVTLEDLKAHALKKRRRPASLLCDRDFRRLYVMALDCLFPCAAYADRGI